MRAFLKSAATGAVLVASALAGPHAAAAADKEVVVTLASILQMKSVPRKLRLDVQLHFAGEQLPAAKATYGETFAIRKTSSLYDSAEESCRRAVLAALLALQDASSSQGGDAVIGLQSYVAQDARSGSDFTCTSGPVVTTTIVKGTYARLAPTR